MNIAKKLVELRKKIDAIDDQLAAQLRARHAVVLEIKKLKKSAKLPNVDQSREKKIYQRLKSDYEKKVFKTIINLSRKLHAPHVPLKKSSKNATITGDYKQK